MSRRTRPDHTITEAIGLRALRRVEALVQEALEKATLETASMAPEHKTAAATYLASWVRGPLVEALQIMRQEDGRGHFTGAPIRERGRVSRRRPREVS